LLAAQEIRGFHKTPRKFQGARRSLIRERVDHERAMADEGATQAMHYRGSSDGRAFC